jgi:hypothetical protein
MWRVSRLQQLRSLLHGRQGAGGALVLAQVALSEGRGGAWGQLQLEACSLGGCRSDGLQVEELGAHVIGAAALQGELHLELQLVAADPLR